MAQSDPKSIFKAVNYLKKMTALGDQGHLEVVYRGTPITVGFSWHDRATKDSISQLKKELVDKIPDDFLLFLTEVSNGAILYSDPQYGQFGFKVFSAEEIIEKQTEWKQYYHDQWQDNFIVFAELIGDLNILLFDTLRSSPDETSFAIAEANLLDDVDDWPSPSRSFHEWLDHLIQAQGDLYWHWY